MYNYWKMYINYLAIVLSLQIMSSCDKIYFKDPKTKKQPKCCDGGFEANHPNCLPIDIPATDHFYAQHKRKCMNFVRSQVKLWVPITLGTIDTLDTN